VAKLTEQVAKLTEQIARLSKNSSNSSKPPSSDVVNRAKPDHPKGPRRQGGQHSERHGPPHRASLPAERGLLLHRNTPLDG
jgi:hypothetical protein